jgi:hypothetical protein
MQFSTIESVRTDGVHSIVQSTLMCTLTAVLECCNRVLNLVPLLNLALICYSSTSTGGPLQGRRSDIFKPKLFEPHLYCCAGAARYNL